MYREVAANVLRSGDLIFAARLGATASSLGRVALEAASEAGQRVDGSIVEL
jgi:hypothetical protein